MEPEGWYQYDAAEGTYQRVNGNITETADSSRMILQHCRASMMNSQRNIKMQNPFPET